MKLADETVTHINNLRVLADDSFNERKDFY